MYNPTSQYLKLKILSRKVVAHINITYYDKVNKITMRLLI